MGRYRPGVVRLVLGLKTEVNPQAFSLRPVGEYAHRLVLDVYPAKPVDPLLTLITELEQQRAAVPRRHRLSAPVRASKPQPAAPAETTRAPADTAKSPLETTRKLSEATTGKLSGSNREAGQQTRPASLRGRSRSSG